MKISDYAKAQGWLKRHASSENSTGEWEKYVALNTTPELDIAIKTINDKYGPGTVFPASEAPIPPMTDQQAIFEFGQRNPQADGGRIGFYKGSFVEGEGWVVKFASPSMKSKGIEMDDKWFGKQVFETEEAMNAAIEERKTISKKNTELKNKKLAERITREAEKGYKDIIDSFIEKGDYENFKSQMYESQMKKKVRSGNLRQTKGGRVPTHIKKFITDRLDAGPGTELFEDLKRITGRTEEELLDFSSKIPQKGSQPIKQRSKKAEESFPEDRKLTDEEKLEGERKQKDVRKTKAKPGIEAASEADLENYRTVANQRKALNQHFIDNPNAINNTEYGKEIKKLMETRLAKTDREVGGKKIKAGEIYRRIKDSSGNFLNDAYYKNLAKQGKIFDIFDINKIAKGQISTKFATNLNLLPSQFNSGFIEGNVDRFFGIDSKTGKKGAFYGDKEKLKIVDDHLKKIGVRVDIGDIGRIGSDEIKVFYDSKTKKFPHMYNTLKKMKIPDRLLTGINPITPIKGEDFNKQVSDYITGKSNKKPMLSSGFAGAFEQLMDEPMMKALANSAQFKKFANFARGTTKYFGPIDLLIGFADYENELSKYKKADGTYMEGAKKAAAKQALQTMSIGLWKGGDREKIARIKETFIASGGDGNVFDKAVAINENQNKISNAMDSAKKNYLKNKETEKEFGVPGGAAAIKFNLNMPTATQQMDSDVANIKRLATDHIDLTNQYVDVMGKDITVEQFKEPFSAIKQAGLDTAKKRWQENYKSIYDKPTGTLGTGDIGEKLTTHLFTTKAPEREEEKRLIEDMKAFDPKELYRYNKEFRNLTRDNPEANVELLMGEILSKPSIYGRYQDFEFKSTGGRTGSYFDGGIASLRRKK